MMTPVELSGTKIFGASRENAMFPFLDDFVDALPNQLNISGRALVASSAQLGCKSLGRFRQCDVAERVLTRSGSSHCFHQFRVTRAVRVSIEEPEFFTPAAATAVVPINGQNPTVDCSFGDVLHVVTLVVFVCLLYTSDAADE